MARTQRLLSGGFSKQTKRRVRSSGFSVVARGTGRSGAETLYVEPDRISTYIKPFYLDRIVDINTALEAVDSLINDNVKGELGNSDFANLLANTNSSNREDFAQYLLDNYGKVKQELIETEEITLKSGKIRGGFRLNRDVYLIKITPKKGRPYIQARSFKTGQVVRLNRDFLARIK